MDKYKVKTDDAVYYIEAESKNKARKEVIKRAGIEIEKVDKEESQGSFIFLEQDDPEWKNVKIGNSDLTIRDYGCLITCLSMLSYWYKDFIKPDEIAKKANFTDKGFYIWKSGDKFLPFNFVFRYYKRDVEKIKNILFSADNACVVRVSYKKGYHWLAVIGYDTRNNQFIGADPLTGDKCYIEWEYGKINGFAEVKRKL